MVRTIVKPLGKTISIDVPEDFIGQQVEVIAFTLAETQIIDLANEPTLTHFASEKILAEDWLKPEEDTAWQNL
ncbi:hypothetical protein A0256_21330 [Mucilaginibacter sp. PAMC 26640]|nr:hypothetical protein A0256_21330 [Mucilaginibacter sp. PAMC 26640]